MLDLSDNPTTEQMLAWLQSEATKAEITAVCLLVSRKSGDNIPRYGSKSQLIRGLECVDSDTLSDAIDDVFPDAEEEQDDDRDSSDDADDLDEQDEDEDEDGISDQE